MPIVPLVGHHLLRDRLRGAYARGALPQSLLLHGEAGIGKQRLALWLAQLLVCERPDPPCGECRHCRYAGELTHPDIMWAFPVPRPKEDRDPEETRASLRADAIARAADHGLYAAPSGSDGIFIATVRMLVQQAVLTPALAARKVVIVGDADRMISQEGSDQAANAFLKLLEEPLPDTYVILTTSALGALLPTVRSRVVAMRVAPMPADDVRQWLTEPAVAAALDKRHLPPGIDERVALAAGAPGRLLSSAATDVADAVAQTFLDAVTSGDREKILRTAFLQGASGARGAFSDVLDAFTVKLHERARRAAGDGDAHAATAASRAAALVEDTKFMASGNVNPQLLTAQLLTDVAHFFA